ncbi:hypothetical protein [uncultured Tateyamaria sp.]|uniref:tetratricopeptide repeat protein n=1 Tax=uncultured Tateyamaria sp. TaxID=455651 RepID=UPI00261C6AD4|nr:hypothetical protein [uncultured Tateyamaria sp.]
MKHVVYAISAVLALVGAAQAQGQGALFQTIILQERADPDAAFHAMHTLAREGHVPAMDRLGGYYRHGRGTPQNLEAARDWYARAVAAGRPWSTASLARTLMDMGQAEAALTLLETGAAAGLPGTERLLATSHVDRHFGDASDRAFGRELLEQLAAAGDAQAARDLIQRHNWGRLPGSAPERVVAQVVAAGLSGDARFAEAALVYLARLGGTKGTKLRQDLAAVPGISDRVLSAERIRIAALIAPSQFWTRVEATLAETEPQNYARAASTAFWINKNAWVRVLQKELRARGLYGGRINGQMTARTIRAQNRFCRDHGLWAVCATGPLRGATVRAVAGAIAKG